MNEVLFKILSYDVIYIQRNKEENLSFFCFFYSNKLSRFSTKYQRKKEIVCFSLLFLFNLLVWFLLKIDLRKKKKTEKVVNFKSVRKGQKREKAKELNDEISL